MTPRYQDICDEVDAAVFSGAILYTDFEEFKEYVERGSRAIAAHELIEEDE